MTSRDSEELAAYHGAVGPSWQSPGRGSSESNRSSFVPRRVESIVGVEAMVAYQNQQAAQRPAGGAYYEAPRPGFRTYNGMIPDQSRHNTVLPNNQRNQKGKQRAARSDQTIGSDESIPLHFGIPPRNSESEPHAQPHSYTPTRAQEDVPAVPGLHLPVPTYRPGSSAVRTGRSPLARKSFTHLAPTSPTGEPREVELEVRVPRRPSISDEEETRGRRGRRRRRSISVDVQGRRRLSKQERGSREPRE